MQRTAELEQENRDLRSLVSRLRQASLRINESLDFDRVLQGTLDSARSLTGARYGVMTILEERGQEETGREVENFITSGMTAGESQGMWDMPGGPGIFEYLSNLPGPLRVGDLSGHALSQGVPEFLIPVTVTAFLAVPMRHRGKVIGHIYVAKSEAGDEFRSVDEETLAMFAAQAAMVIDNARHHRVERQARADLQTLVDTAPVGVVVFNARTGRPASFNREALRIVDGLRDPDQSPNELLDSLTIRRADGQEATLAELPLARLMSAGETVRAEEMTLIAADGRCVSALVNATPVHPEEAVSDDGESAESGVESYVVTLQDLSPLEELERLRADFLAMVSHELATPLTSISGSAAALLSRGAALDPAESRLFHGIIAEQADLMRRLLSDLLDATRLWTGALPVSPEPSEPVALVDEARSAFLAGGESRSVTLDLEPDLPWVMADRRRVLQVLGNLLSNAARHSLATSPIRVSAAYEDGWVSISVIDRGRGIAPNRLPHLFRRFSSADPGNGVDGVASGLGLFICKGIVEAHGGRIRAESEGLGQGSRFTFTLPAVEDVSAAVGRRRDTAPESHGPTRILVVDDDPRTLRHVRNVLNGAGFTPLVAGGPVEAARLMQARNPHLVLLDLMLPGTDGIELMQELRSLADVPFMFLSAYGQEDVVARAFDAGADDYVIKPFSSTELLARIRAALRRRAVRQTRPYVRADLVVNYAERRVTMAGQPVHLRSMEYALLAELCANAGKPLSYEHLAERVWKRTDNQDPRRIRSAMRNLRRKLGDDADNPTYIFTEPRVGYRMAPGDADPARRGGE